VAINCHRALLRLYKGPFQSFFNNLNQFHNHLQPIDYQFSSATNAAQTAGRTAASPSVRSCLIRANGLNIETKKTDEHDQADTNTQLLGIETHTGTNQRVRIYNEETSAPSEAAHCSS
jgi:hypothetical protein